MLSKYLEDNQGPVCKIEDCEGCTKDCKIVYLQACIAHEQDKNKAEKSMPILRKPDIQRPTDSVGVGERDWQVPLGIRQTVQGLDDFCPPAQDK